MIRSDIDHPNAPARRSALAKIIREQAVGRQTELVAMLRKHGHIATQSSVSRDLRELGVAKLGDRYVLPEATASKNDFSSLKQFVSARLTAGTNLTVLKTTVGRRRAWRWPSTAPAGRKSSARFRAMTPYSSPRPARANSAS